MFSINIYLRFALMALTTIGGIVLWTQFGFWYGFPFLLASLALLVGYLMLGTIQSAAELLQKDQNFLAAKKRLDLTLTPKLLYVTNRAYYYLLNGTISQGLGNNDEAEAWLNKAQSLKLPTDNEKAAVQLQLASIAAQRNRWNQVKIHMKAIKELKITEGMIKEQVKQFEQAVKNQGQMRLAQRMGMMPKGGAPLKASGKRKRPKMR